MSSKLVTRRAPTAFRPAGQPRLQCGIAMGWVRPQARVMKRRPMVERRKPKASFRPAPLSPRKRFVLRFIALALPILLLAAVELSLRLFGFGGYAPMFRKLGPVPGGNLVLAAQGGAESWFFGNS